MVTKSPKDIILDKFFPEVEKKEKAEGLLWEEYLGKLGTIEQAQIESMLWELSERIEWKVSTLEEKVDKLKAFLDGLGSKPDLADWEWWVSWEAAETVWDAKDATVETGQAALDKARVALVSEVDKALEKRWWKAWAIVNFLFWWWESLIWLVENSRKAFDRGNPLKSLFTKAWWAIAIWIMWSFLGIKDAKSRIFALWNNWASAWVWWPAVWTPDAWEWGAWEAIPEAELVEARESAKAEIEEKFNGLKTSANEAKLKEIKDRWDYDIDEAKTPTEVEQIKNRVIEEMQDLEIEEDSPEEKEVLSRDVEYSASATFLMSLSLVENDRNQSKKDLLLHESLRTKSISEIRDIYVDTSRYWSLKSDLWIAWDQWKEKALDYICSSFTSPRVEKLVSYGLKYNVVKRIAYEKDWKTIKPRLVELFWSGKDDTSISRIEEILNGLNDNSLDVFIDLSIEELSLLYIETMPWIWIMWLENWFNYVWNYVMWLWVPFNELEIDAWSINSPVSPELLKSFSEKWVTFWANTLLANTYQELGSMPEFNSLNPDQKEELKNLVDFKDWLISPEFLNSKKLWLSPEQVARFYDNLDYRWVIAIYSILGWVKSLEDFNPVVLWTLIYAISVVISQSWDGRISNQFEWSKYLWAYVLNVLKWDPSVDISNEEREIIAIYRDFLFNHYIVSQLAQIWSVLWIWAGLFGNSMYEEAAMAIWGWLLVKTGWNIMIKKWIEKGTVSILWLALKRLWWLSIVWWVMMWGIQFALNNSNNFWQFWEDLQWNIKSWDYDAAIKTIEKFRNSIKTYTLKNWEELHYVWYPWQTPYVTYKWELYSFNLADRSWKAILSGTATLWTSFPKEFNYWGTTVSTSEHIAKEWEIIEYWLDWGGKHEVHVGDILSWLKTRDFETTTGSSLWDTAIKLFDLVFNNDSWTVNYDAEWLPDANIIDLWELSWLPGLHLVLVPIPKTSKSS